MTRATVAVTTYRLRLTCDKCGLRLYTWRATGRGWVVVEGKDYCPGCAGGKGEKESVDCRENV